MLKNTSLVFTIGVYELFADAEIHYSTTFQPVEYLRGGRGLVPRADDGWTVIQAWIERRLAVSERGDELRSASASCRPGRR